MNKRIRFKKLKQINSKKMSKIHDIVNKNMIKILEKNERELLIIGGRPTICDGKGLAFIRKMLKNEKK